MGYDSAETEKRVAEIAMAQRKKDHDVVEPRVIDEEILIDGVDDPIRPDGLDVDPIDFPTVKGLRLSFLNIYKVSNINNFDQLATLRLDNNIIEKIESLGHLKNLRWLDLSFNNIDSVDGLQDLVHLTDLSLYANQIANIEGLEKCADLNILSLGRNRISDMKQIDVIRKLKKLRCVCLDGNPVCKDDRYNLHVLSYLPQLKYRDYMLISQKEVQQAQEQYQVDELAEKRDEEAQEAARAKERDERQAKLAKLRESFLDPTEDLFESLFSDEPPHCLALTAYPQLKEDYKEKLGELIKSLKMGIKDKNSMRLKRVKMFEKAVSQAEEEAEEVSKQLTKAYRSRKKDAFAQLYAPGTSLRAEPLVEELQGQLVELKSQLLTEETQVQEALIQATDIFYTQMKDCISFMCEKAREFVVELENNIENSFKQMVTDAMTQECEQAQQSMDTGEANDAKGLLANRDECMSTLNGFLEGHPGVLATKEEKMTGQMEGWLKTFFEDHTNGQSDRNRRRVSEIKTLIEQAQDELKTLEGHERDEDMYEEEAR